MQPSLDDQCDQVLNEAIIEHRKGNGLSIDLMSRVASLLKQAKRVLPYELAEYGIWIEVINFGDKE